MTGAVLLNLVVAAIAGVADPAGSLHGALSDPAHGASVLLTFVTDGMGFFLFLGLARCSCGSAASHTCYARFIAPSPGGGSIAPCTTRESSPDEVLSWLNCVPPRPTVRSLPATSGPCGHSTAASTSARCVLLAMPVGLELRVLMDGSILRAERCSRHDEAFELAERWRNRMMDRGWTRIVV